MTVRHANKLFKKKPQKSIKDQQLFIYNLLARTPFINKHSSMSFEA